MRARHTISPTTSSDAPHFGARMLPHDNQLAPVLSDSKVKHTSQRHHESINLHLIHMYKRHKVLFRYYFYEASYDVLPNINYDNRAYLTSLFTL